MLFDNLHHLLLEQSVLVAPPDVIAQRPRLTLLWVHRAIWLTPEAGIVIAVTRTFWTALWHVPEVHDRPGVGILEAARVLAGGRTIACIALSVNLRFEVASMDALGVLR